MRRSFVLPTLLALLTCTACGASGTTPQRGAVPPPDERVRVQVGSTTVRAEVADDPDERAVGLMRRDEVPVGTGMVFLFEGQTTARFHMYDVRVPLSAVFARDGQVVDVVAMPPCAERQPQACPTYGPDAPYDSVLEAAPETLRRVRQGDRFVVGGG